MKSAAGLWIDHRKAVIVIVTDEGEETKQIESGMEKHVRFLAVLEQKKARQTISATDNIPAILTLTMMR